MNTTITAQSDQQAEAEYRDLLFAVQARFRFSTQGDQPLFTTNAADLFDDYLSAFSEGAERQHYNCNACRHFLNRFGGLVTIGKDGIATPALWNLYDATDRYLSVFNKLYWKIERAEITGVFLSSDAVLGQPVTGDWHHFSAKLGDSMLYKGRTLTANQKMAEKREDFKTLCRALSEFSLSTIEKAVALLESESLYRSEKLLGQAVWLKELKASHMETRNHRIKANLGWLAVATAPAGFCHPRSSMIGSLLEDLTANLPFDHVARRFADKMHPLQYQRPQAAPSAGAIAAAEKLVEQLGIAYSFPRRFARLDEVEAIWMPTEVQQDASTGKVFGHLVAKGEAPAKSLTAPIKVMTWEKFVRTVLPTAERIEFKAQAQDSYTTLVTAVNADAPPIIQWDHENDRNPVSWYFWHGGSSASSYSLKAGQYYPVSAITLQPSMWKGNTTDHHGKGVMFVIDGARETRQPSGCLFPEILKAELYGARSVIEAYSKEAKMQGMNEPAAAGVMLNGNATQPWNAQIRVINKNLTIEYKLDRWD